MLASEKAFITIALIAAGICHAADGDSPDAVDVSDLDLDSLLNQQIVSSTKTAQTSAETPAVVAVVGADEIHARGYTSISEVLRTVPGFYDVYDLVTHNVGVRGINGGVRASGNVLKVMIDGQPVDFRPTTGNFFGEELLPIQLVERVEIIRGPASALYGANAFLGVVNIVTRSGASMKGVHLGANGGAIRRNPAFGVFAALGGGSEDADFLVGISGHHLDRSGLPLPAASPLLDKSAGESVAARGPSAADVSRPKSLFAKASVGVVRGRLTALASVQNLDAMGEFQETGPLAHGTRVALYNGNYRLSWDATFGALTASAAVQYFEAFPSSRDRLDVGRSDVNYVRRIGVRGFGIATEGRYAFSERTSLTVGFDFVDEDHTLAAFDEHRLTALRNSDGAVLREPGTIVPGEGSGATRQFQNAGAFTQVLVGLTDELRAIAGGRVDVHNVYGANPSARAGLVYAPSGRPLSLKLLYGSSFKAPSALQLYAQPAVVLDILGNPELKAQTAHTFELFGAYGFGDRAELSVSAYVLDVVGRVEFLQRGLFLQAQNVVNEWVGGGEADARFKLGKSTTLRAGLGVARTLSQSSQTATGIPTNALFPTYQAHLIADQQLPWAGLRAAAEVSYIGPRTASQSNALVAGESYDVAAYVFTAASLSMAPIELIPGTRTSWSLRVSNLTNQIWTEPGFGGVDVPAQGISGRLSVSQSF